MTCLVYSRQLKCDQKKQLFVKKKPVWFYIFSQKKTPFVWSWVCRSSSHAFVISVRCVLSSSSSILHHISAPIILASTNWEKVAHLLYIWPMHILKSEKTLCCTLEKKRFKIKITSLTKSCIIDIVVKKPSDLVFKRTENFTIL